jgi:HAD superfamily hydrolase (TIGR01509 family)
VRPVFHYRRPVPILPVLIRGQREQSAALRQLRLPGASLIIFDCNGVLVDSEPIAASVAADEFARVGIPISPEIVAHYFFGRRPADMIAMVEAATGRKLPHKFSTTLTAATVRRFRSELRPMPHAAHALSWLRGPKCVASSSTIERIRASLEITGLDRFFEDHQFSASEVANGKPAPDLFLRAATRMRGMPEDCIVVEDSPAGVSAAAAAGMTPIGFVGGSHAPANLGEQLIESGARTIVCDMRQLKSAVVALRGW